MQNVRDSTSAFTGSFVQFNQFLICIVIRREPLFTSIWGYFNILIYTIYIYIYIYVLVYTNKWYLCAIFSQMLVHLPLLFLLLKPCIAHQALAVIFSPEEHLNLCGGIKCKIK